MQFRWDNCGNVRKGCCGSSVNPVRFELSRRVGAQWFRTHTTPLAADPSNPQTPRFKIPISSFNNGDENCEVKFSAIVGGTGEINRVVTTGKILKTTDIFQGDQGGNLQFMHKDIVITPSMVDYLRCGWHISVCAAIDYTGSNGPYTDPSSLHFMGPSNQYEAALWNVGSVLKPYDSDRSFPLYGFGGIPRHMGQMGVSHFFPVNGNVSNPEVFGIQGMIDAYRSTLPSISLSGPTYFAPLLQNFGQYVSEFNG